MKNTIYLITIALLISACTYKNEAVKLQPYEANYKAPMAKDKKAVFVQSVKDLRSNKTNIGYALEDGKKKITFFTHEDFEKKYKDALLYALNISEFNTNVSQGDATEIIQVNIKDIEIIHTDKSFDENLKGKILVELVVKKGNTITKSNFTQKAGEWMSPSYNSKDIEPFLSALFSDSVNAVVAKLAE